ncbi:hypothetical protein [uncultured Rikenella sp.]|uniref:hypothetical protein n=1 Tax=uncultured Rikenella sp. TaxID=368003 RepID=UPI0025CF72DF|nr:hypothetical protein [uncultured Rikenella sp.]
MTGFPKARGKHPAPGLRERTSGGLSLVGYYGFNNSSSVSGIHNMYLGFGAQSLTPCNVDYRGRGHQLRCLSE